ncbi:YcxB-like protein [Chryseobacterium arachidis]|uniref:YcxB-like protein n=1 Tax=Chryseobacterium arachidis TaxID=1416778 RepID=A0A1M4TBG1_9FLAO|nr:YcxB family protein [Chryseobacterium arachidis]SHE41793.1 YcxB-like protein [Chryseobacterium arachidis]
MTVKTYITFGDFLNFNLKNSLPRIIIFSFIILVFLGLNLYNAERETSDIFRSASIWFAIIVIFMLVRAYFRVKNAFYSNKKIQKEMTYTFSGDNIHIKGETFDGDFSWNTVHKIRENKDWFLIYQSKTTMNMVPKKYFTKSQVSELRNLIRLNNVKAKLRKD